MFGILGRGYRFRDKVTEAFNGEKVGRTEVEVYDENCYGRDSSKRGRLSRKRKKGSEGGGREGGD